MLKLEDLAAWLTAQGLAEPIWRGGVPDDTQRGSPPASLYALVDTGGLGMTVERAFERPTFQALSRAQDQIAARDMAAKLDALIVDATIPFSMNGQRVIDTGRVGGPPQQVAVDDRRRVYYSCNYRLEIAR